ncbi:DUF2497 domain-containing protein [Henriciella aquimarina]|uniref:DUF2497 domain-containing protein n=1 Tax=Henriciella aquimarina TaxID=545261 RepID=UPI000A05E4BC|nr:DUF2497 domain-containing protein [Henriciella aquimarina]
MAEKAQSEPTMEEILASIRKIIADDGEGAGGSGKPAARAEPSVSVNVSDEENFEDLSLDDVIEQSGGSVEELASDPQEEIDPIGAADEDDDLLSDVDESMFDDLASDEGTEAEASTAFDADEGIEELEDFDLEAVNLDEEEPVLAADMPQESFDEPAAEWEPSMAETEAQAEAIPEPEPTFTPQAEPEPQPTSTGQSAMLRGKTETTQAASEGLTDERIAGAAASALGKLMVKQSEDTDNPNTLEGLMTEMLRPMIKEWLDANLPAIVERKVEEEVQRIARMAR